MRRDSRLSVAIHALLHMQGIGTVLTSEQIAAMMGTNAVVVRRTMAGLRDAGILRSVKGHGGGWSLARDLRTVTFADVYQALGAPALFSVGNREESPGCLVEKTVNAALADALADAEAVLLGRLRATSLASLVDRFEEHHRLARAHGARPKSKKEA
ncbi:MAG: Rrf2 family transcriptional regulator [Labilithrix sp.]|nr:Rrf2 family transcriptional regulator [Labilithrix sp.]